mgnify:CR=1 FL=1
MVSTRSPTESGSSTSRTPPSASGPTAAGSGSEARFSARDEVHDQHLIEHRLQHGAELLVLGVRQVALQCRLVLERHEEAVGEAVRQTLGADVRPPLQRLDLRNRFLQRDERLLRWKIQREVLQHQVDQYVQRVCRRKVSEPNRQRSQRERDLRTFHQIAPLRQVS